MVDVVVPQGIVEGISQELQRTSQRNPKGISKEGRAESQRNPRCLKVISKEPQRSSTGITKETARNLRNLEDAGTRQHRQSLGISKESQKEFSPLLFVLLRGALVTCGGYRFRPGPGAGSVIISSDEGGGY